MELEKTKLSLFQIEAELRGLAEARCDALDRLEAFEADNVANGLLKQPLRQDVAEAIKETKAELATIDGLIRAYISKEVQKVDNTARLLLELKARAGVHRAEAERLYMLAKSEEATEARVKELVLAVMDEFGEKKLFGASHQLMAKGNGGVRAVTVAQADLVPAHLQRVTVRMTQFDWANIAKPVMDRNAYAYEVLHTEPNNTAIRQVLESGAGVPGCRLEDRGKHLGIR